VTSKTVWKKQRGFTLIELLVVIFILTTVAFVSVPNFFKQLNDNKTIGIASYLKALREEAISTKKSTTLDIDFKERLFTAKGGSGEKIIKMKDDETWQLYLPSKGLIKDGSVKVIFPPTISEEFLALYLTKSDKEFTITLNNLTGEVEIEEGRKNFSE